MVVLIPVIRDDIRRGPQGPRGLKCKMPMRYAVGELVAVRKDRED